ncbi:INPP5D [Symbiodinium natans]|uniref:INPP5D protein n=1 Tax=Symbiodinium natans TaxID=878477 RepID=A0A812ICM1_9DINO|nr:INPP5D [Symbiodinium natans]
MGAHCGRFIQACKHLRTIQFRAGTHFGGRTCELWDKADKVVLTIFAGTWNMGNAQPPDDLRDWLQPGYDIYLIGVQECNYHPRPWLDTCARDWRATVEENLPGLVQVCKHEMGHCQILCYATDKVSRSIHNVAASHEETGLGGFLANKGGLALSFWIGDTSICFVCSHLAAHQRNIDRRNSDTAHIIEGICLTKDQLRPLTHQFTHVFWVGDLNYRIDLDREACEELICEHAWEKLREHDQLLKVQQEEKAFWTFQEGPLNFAPTYQHIPGMGPDPETGLRPYDPKKGRVPSWTDRVLWQSFPDVDVTQLPGSYTSSPTLCTSDHSPVSAVFQLPLNKPFRIQETAGFLYIQIQNLRATGLPPGDHHVSFWGQYCEGTKHTTNATSKDGCAQFSRVTLRTRPGVCSSKWVQTRHLLVAIYKVDDALESAHMKSHPVSTLMAMTGLVEGFEEPDGYGVVSLRGAGAGKSFTAALSNSWGYHVGSLHGEVKISTFPTVESRSDFEIANVLPKTPTWETPSNVNARLEDSGEQLSGCCLNVKTMRFM